jgi:hypothetical protein
VNLSPTIADPRRDGGRFRIEQIAHSSVDSCSGERFQNVPRRQVVADVTSGNHIDCRPTATGKLGVADNLIRSETVRNLRLANRIIE